MKNTKPHVIILGGGVAGLTVGWRLSQEGIPITLLERENEVGGLSKTTKFKGFLFDYSAHRFNSDNPEVIRRFKKLVGNHLLKKEKLTYIRHWNRYLLYPPVAGEIIKAMPKDLLLKASFEFLFSALKNFFTRPPRKSFSDWTRSVFGKTFSHHFNEKYAEKIWKRPARQLSSDWASTRVGNFNSFELLKAVIFNSRSKDMFPAKSHPDSSWFYYSDVGIGYFPQQIKKEIESLKGDVKTNSIVYKIQRKEGKYEVYYREKGVTRRITGAYIVSSLPFDILLRSIGSSVPQLVKDAASKLEYLAVLVVNIIVKNTHLPEASWIYYPDKDVLFNYILEYKYWSKKMVSGKYTSISANITCRLGDSLWRLDDKEIVKRAIDDLQKIGAIRKADVREGFVVRLPYAYPVLDVDYRLKLEVIEEFIKTLPHFYLIGRTGRFDYINSDKVMENALALSKSLVKTIKHAQ